MKNPGIAEALAAVEPTFQAQNTWRGYYTLAGRPAYVRVDDDWMEVRMPLCGDARLLLSRQHELAGLVKIGAGDFLLAELPARRGEWVGAFRLLRAQLERGLDHFEGAPGDSPGAGLDAARLQDCLNQSGVDWVPRGSTFRTPLEEGPSPASHAVAGTMGEALAIRTTLTRLREPSVESLAAMTHFLLAFNQRVRLARASAMPDRIVLEVVLPPACATPALVERAVRSLRAGAAASRRECAALMEPEIASAYLQFHIKGENA